jgi:hypothetical protein
MRQSAATWAQRVEEWRSSGETSERFAERRGFSAGALRHWAYRLGRTKGRQKQARLRLVRVERRPASTDERELEGDRDARLHVDVCGVRVAIGKGFDASTLMAVVDVLERRRGR